MLPKWNHDNAWNLAWYIANSMNSKDLVEAYAQMLFDGYDHNWEAFDYDYYQCFDTDEAALEAGIELEEDE